MLRLRNKHSPKSRFDTSLKSIFSDFLFSNFRRLSWLDFVLVRLHFQFIRILIQRLISYEKYRGCKTNASTRTRTWSGNIYLSVFQKYTFYKQLFRISGTTRSGNESTTFESKEDSEKPIWLSKNKNYQNKIELGCVFGMASWTWRWISSVYFENIFINYQLLLFNIRLTRLRSDRLALEQLAREVLFFVFDN